MRPAAIDAWDSGRFSSSGIDKRAPGCRGITSSGCRCSRFMHRLQSCRQYPPLSAAHSRNRCAADHFLMLIAAPKRQLSISPNLMACMHGSDMGRPHSISYQLLLACLCLGQVVPRAAAQEVGVTTVLQSQVIYVSVLKGLAKTAYHLLVAPSRDAWAC